jgi:general secretion pathway protein J
MSRPHPPITRDRHSDGFTLLEILVALVVMGFLLIGLAQGTHFGLRAWNAQTRIIDQRSELDAVDRTLRQLVQEASPGDQTSPAPLLGTAERLLFTTELPRAASLTNRLADVVLAVNGAHELVLRWTPHLHAARFGPPPPPHQALLLRGVARLQIAYWRQGGAGGWLTAWSDPDLPALIRIHIAFLPGDRRDWPDIVAATMMTRPGT